MTLEERLNEIVEKQQGDAIIPFLQGLTQEERKSLVPRLINTVSSSSSWRLWKALRLYMLSYTCVVKRFNGASSMLISRARISPTRWLFILPVESPSTHNSAA